MSGVGLTLSIDQFEALQRRINAMAHMDTRDLMDSIGAEVATQIQRRIGDEKTTPQGEAWAPWSDAYAATRHGGQSLLVAEAHLVGSITHLVELTGKEVDVGSNLIYAAMQNFGGAEVGKPGLPARTFEGLSTENRMDVLSVASDWLDHHLARTLH